MSTINELTQRIIGAAIEVHRQLGPGLLESAYEECLARELQLRGVAFDRQKPIPVVYKGVKLECGYRIDLLVENRVVVELKAIEAIAPVHEAVVLTYLKLSGNRVGLLINFHVPVLKDGIRRYIWKEKKELTTELAEIRRGNGEDSIVPYA
jgi:GxxExxY protein